MSDQEPQEGQTRSGFATLFDLLLSAALFGAATWMLVTALQWPWESGLFPGIVAGVMMALAAIQLARQILQMVSRRGAAGGSRVVDLTVDEDLPVALVVRRATALWVWILGLFASILLIGFVLSIPLFVLLYHIIQGRERITVAAAWAVAGLAFTIGLFDMLLHTRWLVPLWPAAEQALLDTVHRYLGAGV